MKTNQFSRRNFLEGLLIIGGFLSDIDSSAQIKKIDIAKSILHIDPKDFKSDEVYYPVQFSLGKYVGEINLKNPKLVDSDILKSATPAYRKIKYEGYKQGISAWYDYFAVRINEQMMWAITEYASKNEIDFVGDLIAYKKRLEEKPEFKEMQNLIGKIQLDLFLNQVDITPKVKIILDEQPMDSKYLIYKK